MTPLWRAVAIVGGIPASPFVLIRQCGAQYRPGPG
jgi:hypothetical protein